jgi:hypothetical protein
VRGVAEQLWPARTPATPARVGGLTVVNGDVTLDQAGAVLENKEVHGCVTVSAGGVTIKNSRIIGGCNYVVQTTGSADSAGSSRLTIQDTEISCDGQPHNGIGDNNVNVIRVEISKCENGMDIDNRFTVQDSYIHDLVTCCGAHTDGAQLNAQGTDISSSTTRSSRPRPAARARSSCTPRPATPTSSCRTTCSPAGATSSTARGPEHGYPGGRKPVRSGRAGFGRSRVRRHRRLRRNRRIREQHLGREREPGNLVTSNE